MELNILPAESHCDLLFVLWEKGHCALDICESNHIAKSKLSPCTCSFEMNQQMIPKYMELQWNIKLCLIAMVLNVNQYE